MNGNSNRDTYEELEPRLTRTKQTIASRSNRGIFRFYRINRPLPRARFGAPAPFGYADHHPLNTGHSAFLIGTAKLNEFPLSTRKISNLTLSNRDKFQHVLGQGFCPRLVTCHSSPPSNRKPKLLDLPVTHTKQSLRQFLIANFGAMFRRQPLLVLRSILRYNCCFTISAQRNPKEALA
jgi:hypothetical protein